MSSVEVLGDFVLQRRERRLLDAQGHPVKLGSRAMALLIVLAEKAGEVIDRDELMALAWPGLVLEPNTLRVHMASLRKALGDSQQAARYIATIPGRGYCLVVGAPEVRVAVPPERALPVADEVVPDLSSAHRALPASLASPMIGREQALQQLVDALPRQRLTTLVAAGGMGKTTLALEAARAVAPRFGQGACFIDLSLADERTMASIVSRALGLDGEGSMAMLTTQLAASPVLLVLDNCEHVLLAAADLAARLLEAGPQVHVLATSREPLGLADEQVHWLPGLALPMPGQPLNTGQPLAYAALALLTDCVRARDGGSFVLGANNIDDAVALCRRLDGMPLAIELVAARVASLGLRPVLASLDEELLSLRHPRRTVVARQQTLGALLNWSHVLLDDTERAVLRCCGLFAGGFTFEAARDLMSAVGLDALEAMGSLAGLLGKSWVQPASDVGAAGFRLHETTRAFARLQIDAKGEGAQAWQAHRRQLSRWIAQARADRAVLGPDEWRQRHGWMGLEIRAAIERALSLPDGVADALSLVGESWSFALALLPTELMASLIEQVRGKEHCGDLAVPMRSQEGLKHVLGDVLQSLTDLQAA